MNVVKAMETPDPTQDPSNSCRGIILMYHRVTKAEQDNWQLNVSPANFEEHLKVIKKYGIPIKLQEIIQQHFISGAKGIALTFDDGYSDNFHNAKPLLERYGIPATFYVVSGVIDSKEEYWWDELEKIVFEDGVVLPEKFKIGAEEYIWPRTVTSQGQLIHNIGSVLRPLPGFQRNEFMHVLRSLNGRLKPRYLPLTRPELFRLASCKLFDIGAHSVTHPTLGSLTEEEQEKEIAQSKRHLEELLNRPVTSFAYPYGSYSDTSISVLKRLKFKNACTVTVSPVYHNSDPYQMPRFAVRDWNGEEFESRLKAWLGHQE